MAKTEFGVNHPLAVKVFSKQLATEVISKTYLSKFIGKGKGSLVQELTDLKKSAGDQITHGLRVQISGTGIQGDATLEGNEEALSFYDDAILVNQLRHATRTNGKMTEQRVPYYLRAESRDALSDWFAERMDTAFFAQICGYTAQSDTRYTGNNATIAPSTNRIIRAGNQANDNSITSSDIFTLDLIDIVVERAKTVSTLNNTGPKMRPLKMDGKAGIVPHIATRNKWESGQMPRPPRVRPRTRTAIDVDVTHPSSPGPTGRRPSPPTGWRHTNRNS